MNRRPTVPLADWRIAVHLDASAKVQNQPGTPAYGCACRACEAWRKTWSLTLPAALVQQLRRLRIDLNHPAELYAYDQSDLGASCRVTFHCVGRLLRGPDCWRKLENGERMLDYRCIREGEDFINMAVYPHRQTFLVGPENTTPSSGDLLQIDMRLRVFREPACPRRDGHVQL